MQQRLATRMLERRSRSMEAEIKRLHATVGPGCCPKNEKLRAENAELRAEIVRFASRKRRTAPPSGDEQQQQPQASLRVTGIGMRAYSQPRPKGGWCGAPGGQAGSRRKNPAGGGEAGQNGRAVCRSSVAFAGGRLAADRKPHSRGRQIARCLDLPEPELSKSPNTAWAKSNAVGQAQAGNIRRM